MESKEKIAVLETAMRSVLHDPHVEEDEKLSTLYGLFRFAESERIYMEFDAYGKENRDG